MMKRNYLSVSLRALLLLITLVAVGLAVWKQLYYERYARPRHGHQYFESLDVIVRVGDPCPKDFVYWLDGIGRYQGLAHTETPDFIDRLAGRRLSHPPVRELSFRGSFSDHHRFNLEMANKLATYTPGLEKIELGYGARPPVVIDPVLADTTIAHLSKLPELRLVSIIHWPVTDEHLESLAALPRLQVLGLQCSDLSDKSFESIRKMKELRFLGINCPTVTQEAAEAFHRDRPEVFARINSVEYGSRDGIYFYEKH